MHTQPTELVQFSDLTSKKENSQFLNRTGVKAKKQSIGSKQIKNAQKTYTRFIKPWGKKIKPTGSRKKGRECNTMSWQKQKSKTMNIQILMHREEQVNKTQGKPNRPGGAATAVRKEQIKEVSCRTGHIWTEILQNNDWIIFSNAKDSVELGECVLHLQWLHRRKDGWSVFLALVYKIEIFVVWRLCESVAHGLHFGEFGVSCLLIIMPRKHYVHWNHLLPSFSTDSLLSPHTHAVLREWDCWVFLKGYLYLLLFTYTVAHMHFANCADGHWILYRHSQDQLPFKET